MRGLSLALGVLGWAVLNLPSLADGVSPAPAVANGETALSAYPSTVDALSFPRSLPIRIQIEFKAGRHDLNGIVLSNFSNDAIAASVEGGDVAAKVAQMRADEAHVWTLLLKPLNGSAFPPATLHLYVNATYFEGKYSTVPRILSTTVTLNGPSGTAAPNMATLEVKGALSALSFERPAKAFVAVTNKYQSELTIIDIGIHGPPFARFEPVDKPPYPALAFGDTKVIEYDVKAPEQVVPGKYPVVVAVYLRGADGVTGSVTTSPEIDVGILGESDLLSKLGAPSLLFLPGVLFLLTWQLLWSRRKSDDEKKGYPLQPTTAAFWLVGVVISLVTAVAYPTITLWLLQQKRDYLVAYGLRDYMYVFGLAIVTSFALYLIWQFLRSVGARVYSIWLTFFTPRVGDQPIDILKKLAKAHAETIFGQAYADGGSQTELLLVLEPWSQDILWLTPPARLSLVADTNYQAVGLHDKIVNGQITGARQLADIVKEGVDAGWWTIAWATVGQYNGLVMAKPSAWHLVQRRGRLVQ